MSTPGPDAYRLVARLLAAAGIHPDALMVERFDVMAMIIVAREIGRHIEVARIAGVEHCTVCGCTDLTPCRPEPCGWARPGLCTTCAEFADTAQ